MIFRRYSLMKRKKKLGKKTRNTIGLTAAFAINSAACWLIGYIAGKARGESEATVIPTIIYPGEEEETDEDDECDT